MTQQPPIDDTYEQIIEQPHTTTFQSQNNHFLAQDEQTSWITPAIKLPPANLQKSLPIIPLFAFPPPDSPQANTSSGMNSDTNSDITIYATISQFNNSDIEIPMISLIPNYPLLLIPRPAQQRINTHKITVDILKTSKITHI